MNTFVQYPNINPDLISFKKSQKINENLKLIPIKYLVDTTLKDLIFQTPKMYIPFGMTKYNNKYSLSLSFKNYKHDKSMINFYNKIIC